MTCLRSLRIRICAEQGIVLPAVLFLTLIAGSLAATAVAGAVVSQRQSTHDRQVKRAGQAADAGLNAALYRLNMLEPEADECVGFSGDGKLASLPGIMQDIGGENWCPPVTGALPDDASFSYVVSALDSTTETRTIVSTGTSSDRVQRRVAANAKRQLDAALFDFAAIGFDQDIESNFPTGARIWEDCTYDVDGHCGADVAARGALRIDNQSVVCGNAFDLDGRINVRAAGKLNPSTNTVGDNPTLCPAGNLADNPAIDVETQRCVSSAIPIPDCGNGAYKYTWDAVLDRIPSATPRPIPPVNDNCRLSPVLGSGTSCTTEPQAELVRGSIAGSNPTVIWDESRLTLQLKSNSRVELPGGDYVFCYIELMSTSELHFSGSTRIFMKSPEDCVADHANGYTHPTDVDTPSAYQTWGSVSVSGTGAGIYNDATSGPNPDVTRLQFYLTGSNDRPTSFFNTSSALEQDEFSAVIWAPRSDVTFKLSGWITGSVAGKTFTIDTGTRLKYNDSAKQIIVPGAFNRLQDWIECRSDSPPAGTDPSSGCGA